MDDKLRQICFFMFLKGFIVSWVDLLTLALVIAGVCRGRKRGMSEELLDLIKWLLTVVIAGRLYQPLGRVLAGNDSVVRGRERRFDEVLEKK